MGSYLTGPLQLGTGLDNTAAGTGYVLQSQTVTLAQNSTTAVSATITVPANSQLVSIIPDVTTAFNSATSAVLSVGTAAAGTQYVGSVDAKTAGRAVPSYTGAQLAAMANVGTNTSVVATVTPTGATSAGAVRVTIIYAQIA